MRNLDHLYVVTYSTWRYGTAVYLVECTTHFPTEDEVCAFLEIEFEPDKEEHISIDPLQFCDFVKIP